MCIMRIIYDTSPFGVKDLKRKNKKYLCVKILQIQVAEATKSVVLHRA